jgi:hypothetical protein
MKRTSIRLALLLTLAAPMAARAAPTIPPNPENMSEMQLQGVACILTGVVTAAGAIYYSGTLAAAAAAADWSIPLLVIPAAAGGYAVGCSVGSITGPGVHWLYLRYLASD